MGTSEQLMTLSQAADNCACSTKTLRRAIDAGQLTACRLGSSPKSDRIHPADLNAWWAKCKVKTCQSPSVPMDTTKLPSVSADEQLESLLATGRSRTPKTTSAKCLPRSATLRLVASRSA